MNKEKILHCILISTIIILTVILIFVISNQNDMDNNFSTKVLTTNNLGKVSIEGPYGNKSSKVKIAFIVGVHPLESNSHNVLLALIRNNSESLNHSYYIYVVNVTKDKNDFDKGRLNGQLLARDYVGPHIISSNFTFVVDIHSHRHDYVEDTFIVAPINDKKSKEIGNKIIEGIKGMQMLKFEAATDNSPSSPDYVTIPIIKNGTPSIIFETLIDEPNNTTNSFLSQFIKNLDNINFNDLT